MIQNDFENILSSDKTPLDLDENSQAISDKTDLDQKPDDSPKEKDVETIKEKLTTQISQLKTHYEKIIAEILAEKNKIEEQYKTSLIKQDLQSHNVNVELVYTVIKGRGDLEHIKYKNGIVEGLDELISSYKKDENIAPLFEAKIENTIDGTNNVYSKILKTKPLNTSSNTSKFEKEKNKICSDWCSKN